MSTKIFRIAPEIFSILPGLRVVTVVAEGIGAARTTAVEDRWKAAWSDVHERFGHPNPQSHPHIRAWREAMKRAGASHKRFPTSIEALVRRALKSPHPFRVNPLVDFYNAISLEHVVPAGAFDLDALPAPLELRVTRAGDTFQALDAGTAEAVPAGEVAYLAGTTIVTRHLMWRQSTCGLVSGDTRRAILLSETLPSQDRLAAEVRRSLVEGLRAHFGIAAEAKTLCVECPSFARRG